jgi:HK97 family phage major capsid protein
MPYNSLTSRGDASALIPEDHSREIIEGALQESAALRLFRKLPMSTKQHRMPVLSALPTAYWVNGDTGLKQTTKMAWANKYIEAEPIAAIVPIPEEVLDDAEFDLFAQFRPRIVEAIATAVDETMLFGLNKPTSFPDGVVTEAVAKGHFFTLNSSATADGGIAEDFNQLLALPEEDGFNVTNVLARGGIKSKIRGARDANGQQLLDTVGGGLFGGQYPLEYLMNDIWPIAAGIGTYGIDAIAGDFNQGIVGVRQDITYKVLTEAPITDNTGAIILNLAQQDAVALRVVARFGFAVANPISRVNVDETSRYAFSVLRTAGA